MDDFKEKQPDAVVPDFDEDFDLDGSIREQHIRVRKSRQRLDDFDDEELSSIPSQKQLVDGEMEFDDPESNNKLNQAFEHQTGDNASYFGSSGAEEDQSSDTVDSEMMAAYQFAIRQGQTQNEPVTKNVSAIGLPVPTLDFKLMEEQQRLEMLEAQKQLQEQNEQEESEEEDEDDSEDLEMIEALNMIEQQQQPLKKDSLIPSIGKP